jgi:UDP:flavonoid glycosyltransferase YjiC (YdhE family)
VKGAVLVFSPGLPKSMVRKYRSPRMVITAQPVKLAGILPGCDLVICHAGHGTVAASLLAGVPLLLLPTQQQLEQHLTASRVVQMGAGLLAMLPPRKDPPAHPPPEPDYRTPLIRLLSRPAFAEHAKAFAAAHADFDQATQCDAMVRRIEEILGR